MTSTPSDPLWPRSFWSEVPDSDRAALREVLAELLACGVLLGSRNGKRDLYLLVRDHYRSHLEDYLAPLALELLVDEDNLILQARPRPETCYLHTGQFDRASTLVLLTLWRLFDDHMSSGRQEAVIVTVDQLWSALKIFFESVTPPHQTQLEDALKQLKRFRLIDTVKPEGMTQAGEMQIEILPSLARVIPFDDIAAWQQRVEQYQPVKDSTEDGEVAA